MALDEPSATIEDLGGYLREKRTAQRVKLEDLSSRTRISVRFLEAIEGNQFDQLPNPVSARGFLRTYARALSLPEEPILRRFAELTEQVPLSSDLMEDSSTPVIKPAPAKEPVSMAVKMGIPLGILGILLLLIWMVSQGKGKEGGRSVESHPLPADVPSSSPPSFPKNEAPAPKPPEPSPEPSLNRPVLPAPSISVSASSSPATPLVLEIEAVEASWLNVEIDNGANREVLLHPGDKVRWEARDRFVLTLGNAGGVKVNYNGKPLDPFGPSGKVMKGIVLVR